MHNGIIENYDAIKTMLIEKGFTFKSETDTEVFVNLVQYFMDLDSELSFPEAVRSALNEVYGAYAITVMHDDFPGLLVVARLGSPLAIGLGDNEYFIASDASPFVEFTKEAIYLEEGHMATISLGDGVEIRSIKDNQKISPAVRELKLSLEQIEKGGYEHFMLKEIFEQPKSIHDTMRGRLLVDEGIIKMAGIWDHLERINKAERIIIIACGTSWHAGLIGEYLIEEFARIPVEVEYASEFRYRNPIITNKDVVIAISQSGETADLRAVLTKLRSVNEDYKFLVLTNVDASTLSRECDYTLLLHAGVEIAVASTKAYTAQIATLSILAYEVAKQLSKQPKFDIEQELSVITSAIESILDDTKTIKDLAKNLFTERNAFYIGRGIDYYSACEAALKLKEVSYIQTEGFAGGELKHGTIALIEERTPVVALITSAKLDLNTRSNVSEVASRGANTLIITLEKLARKGDYAIPNVNEDLAPIASIVVTQLFAYYAAYTKGLDVDKPRNLAKSVTVE